MSKYMPSEIARLVLGYLKETDCTQSWYTFLNESPHLREYADGYSQGIQYPTSIGGNTLTQIINGQSECHSNNNNNIIINESPIITYESTPVMVSSHALKDHVNMINTQTFRVNDYAAHELNTQLQCNERSKVNENIFKTQFKSPFKSPINYGHSLIESDGKSPRRKGMPRRRLICDNTDITPVLSQRSSQTIDSSPYRSSQSNSSLIIDDDMSSPFKFDDHLLVQPEMIVEQLLNFAPLHDALADTINKAFNSSNESENAEHKTPVKDESTIVEVNVNETGDDECNNNFGCEEIPLPDTAVQNIISNLESAPEFSTLLDMITEKGLQMTPFKDFSPLDSISSNTSLNTPVNPKCKEVNDKSLFPNNAIKNLMSDLRTPEKCITLYSSVNSPNRTPKSKTIRMTPVKVMPIKVVTPIKVVKSNATQVNSHELSNKSIVIPNLNTNLNVITNNDDVQMISVIDHQNANTADTLYIRFEPSPSPSLSPSLLSVPISVPSSAILTTALTSANIMPVKSPLFSDRPIIEKRVDFTKVASKLQIKRPEMPRNILPKIPINQIHQNPVSPIVTNANPNTINMINSVIPSQRLGKFNRYPRVIRSKFMQNQCEVIDSQKRNQMTHENKIKEISMNSHQIVSSQSSSKCDSNKRINSETIAAQSKKSRVTHSRLPSAKILRNMNVNEFLNRIHR